MSKTLSSEIAIGPWRFHRAWLILVGCCFLQAGALGTILTSSGVFFVPVCTELGFTRAEFSTWITAYFLAGIVCMPFAGILLSRFNIRIVMSTCVIAVASAAALMSTYTELWQFIFSGAIYGSFGTCVFMVPYSSMLGNWFMKRTGVAMGVASCAAAIAAAVFSPMFQFFITEFGWRTTYLVQGAIVAGFILPWSLFVFRLRPKDVGIDPYGYDPSQRPVDAMPSKGGSIPGVPWKKAIITVPFITLFIYSGVAALVGSGFDSHIPGIAISFGYDATLGALMVSALQMGSFCDKILMGWLNDKIGVQRTIYVEFAVTILGIVGLIFFRNPYLLLIAAFFFGVQDSLLAISVPTFLRQLFGRKDYTKLYAWTQVGVGLFGSFASVFVGLSFDLTTSFVPALCGAIVICLLGSILVTAAYHGRKKLKAIWEA
jgi:MFS family permease